MIGPNRYRSLSLCLLATVFLVACTAPTAILGVPDSARDRGSEASNRAEQWLVAPRVGAGSRYIQYPRQLGDSDEI